MSIQPLNAPLSVLIPASAPPKRVARHRPRRPLILSEELFRDVLRKERKRADRSNQSAVLLLVAANDGLGANSPSTWALVTEVLTKVARETDVLGWFEWRAVMGLIVTECSSSAPANARALESRIVEELARRSDEEMAGRLSIRIHVHSEPARLADNAPAPSEVASFPALNSPQGRATIDPAIKRALDIIGSLTLLVLLSPLFLLIAALAKVKSPGPVFFRQVRVGQMMKPFAMLKFRTMHVGADNTLHQAYMTRFINSTAETCGAEKIFKLADDPRVTPVGRILRKTSLDELPQLWNVLRGDMSLVGPRPPLGYELEQYKPWHYRRVLEAKPGITGLWQVAGRSRTTFDQMVRLDLRYARTCSVWTDIKILLATPAAVISGKGAC
ncbi:MAG TPA: sugar transferase [Vicinamibacterales bacterium]|jgi:lipopolysaccharide/colanic/teichoic acid biosynthesis glycosyltransferase